MPFISGGYSVTLGGSTLGQIEDGIRQRYSFAGEAVRGDNMGDTVQDVVFRGLSDYMYFDMVLTEYNASGALAAFWYWSTTFGTIDDGIVGKTLYGLASSLVLTKVAGPSATPSTLTAAHCILAPGNSVELLYAPRLKRVPLSFICLPYLSSTNKFFSTT